MPPVRVWVTLASLATAILLVRAGGLELVFGTAIDGAVRNIITLILAFAALMSLVVWFLWESGHPRARKWTVAGALAGLVLAGMALVRVERVSGDLVPQFAWRWQRSPDFLLERHPAVAPADGAAPPETTVPWTATPGDHPRFLGADGTATVTGVQLDPDWEARPPRQVWRRPLGAGWSGFATCGSHAVTLEQRGDEELVACYSLDDGADEWAVAVPARHQTVLGGVGPRSTPTIHDGVVYATGATGWLHAIDGATGRVVWRKDVCADLGIDPVAHALAVAWGRAGSPLVVDDLVVVPGGGPRDGGAVSLVAYDRADGSRRWLAGDRQIAYASPVIATFAGRRLIITVNEGEAAGYDPADGQLVWRCEWPGHSSSDANCSQPVPLDDRRFLLSKGYGLGAAVFRIADPTATPWAIEPVWRETGLLKTKFTSVVLRDGHVYGLSDGILECVAVADGRRAWKGGRYGQGQVLLVGDLLVVQAESGEVVLVEANPTAHRVRARLAALSGQTWNNPTLAGDRLLVRNAEEAACYIVPQRGPAADATAAVAPGPVGR
jgi:outer membrane protein assembly factor BamB